MDEVNKVEHFLEILSSATFSDKIDSIIIMAFILFLALMFVEYLKILL